MNGEPEPTAATEQAPESVYQRRAQAHARLAQLEVEIERKVQARFFANEQVAMFSNQLKELTTERRNLLIEVKSLRDRKPKPKRGRPLGSKDKTKRVRKAKTGQTEASGETTEAS